MFRLKSPVAIMSLCPVSTARLSDVSISEKYSESEMVVYKILQIERACFRW